VGIVKNPLSPTHLTFSWMTQAFALKEMTAEPMIQGGKASLARVPPDKDV